MEPDDLDELVCALGEAEADRQADVTALGGLTAEQLDYLARVDELEDPATDGVENPRCV